jgi:aryl-alcohol dehydrogenase-like predicted oxidoreductase
MGARTVRQIEENARAGLVRLDAEVVGEVRGRVEEMLDRV